MDNALFLHSVRSLWLSIILIKSIKLLAKYFYVFLPWNHCQYIFSNIVYCFTTGPRLNPSILAKELTIRGFFIYNWLPKWPEAFKAIGEWIDQVNYSYVTSMILHCLSMYEMRSYMSIYFNIASTFICIILRNV